MPPRVSRLLAVFAIVALGGCAQVGTINATNDVKELTGPLPRENTTPMVAALACLRTHRTDGLRLGVSDFVDGTGAMDGGTQNSRALSQRPDMMMVTALAGAGAHLVNRTSVNVAEWELNKALEKKLGDGRPAMIDQHAIDFRPVKAGILLGSTHYVSGAITEMNWNIDSDVQEGGAFSIAAGRRTYRISIAIDVMVTNTQTTEIVFARSYKKQLVGFETNANLFRFVNRSSLSAIAAAGNTAAAAVAATSALELFEANIGEKQNEPTQTALRWLIELSAFDIMRNVGHAGPACDSLLPAPTLDALQDGGGATFAADPRPLKPVAMEAPRRERRVEASEPEDAKPVRVAAAPRTPAPNVQENRSVATRAAPVEPARASVRDVPSMPQTRAPTRAEAQTAPRAVPVTLASSEAPAERAASASAGFLPGSVTPLPATLVPGSAASGMSR